jgi:hypothetical protein
MPTIPGIKEMQIKTTLRFYHTEKGTLIHHWWECKLVQTLWKTVWRLLKKIIIDLQMIQQYHS